MQKVKVRFTIDDFTEEKTYDMPDDWTYTDIDYLFESWIWDNTDCDTTILEVDGEPYKYN